MPAGEDAPGPSRTRAAPRSGPASGARSQARLPWWGVALPVCAFAVLLGLMTSGGAGSTASGGEPAGWRPVVRVLERVEAALPAG